MGLEIDPNLPGRKGPQMIPTTTDRVRLHTAADVNEQIRARTAARIAQVAAAGPGAIEERLRELDAEWDIERTLEANASGVALLGLVLGMSVSRRWYALPTVVAGFLLQHAVQGWCPPLPILRRLGFRTETEINHERYALKALRGDFQGVQPSAEASVEAASRVETAIDAVRR